MFDAMSLQDVCAISGFVLSFGVGLIAGLMS